MQLLRGALRRLSLPALMGVMAACMHSAPIPAVDTDLTVDIREDQQQDARPG